MLFSQMALSLIAALPTAAAPADWQADYGKALEESREAAKPLVVVIDRPGSEGETLDPELLSPNSGAFPLGSYELCRIDASTEYGKQVAEVFHVTEFPHVAIIDKTGSVILKRLSGQVGRDTWASALRSHEQGLRRSARSYTVAKPVVSQPAAAAYATPSISVTPSTGGYVMPQPSSSSYCPSCQLR